jgi:hypothetical protein
LLCSTLLCSFLLCYTLLCSVYSPHRQSRRINAEFYLSIDYAARPRLFNFIGH